MKRGAKKQPDDAALSKKPKTMNTDTNGTPYAETLETQLQSDIDIPDEIWNVIFSHLPKSSLVKARLVNKLWLGLIQGLCQQSLDAYFPYLQAQEDYQNNPLKLFTQEYQRYQ